MLGEPPLKMLRYQQQFTFFDVEALDGRVRFISLSEDAMVGDLDRLLRRIVDEVTRLGPAFLTDAIVVQRYIEVDSRLRRVMAVVKVRASAHSDELREYRIDAAGIHIGSVLADQEGLLGGRPSRKRVVVRPAAARDAGAGPAPPASGRPS